jgi:dihydroorotase
MKILIQGGRVIDPASRFDAIADVAVAAGRILSIGRGAHSRFHTQPGDPSARGCVVAPGLVDLAARLREPGHEHEGMLESEMAAAVAGGVTSVVCPPDTDPVLDEPGLVAMLKYPRRKAPPGARVPARRAHPRPARRGADRNGRSSPRPAASASARPMCR